MQRKVQVLETDIPVQRRFLNPVGNYSYQHLSIITFTGNKVAFEIMAILPPSSNTEVCPSIPKIEFEPSKDCQNALATRAWLQNLTGSRDLISGLDEDVIEPSARIKVNEKSYFDLKTPLRLSPSATASTTPSTGVQDDVWDSPLPSRAQLTPTSNSAVSTPLTPPDKFATDEEGNSPLQHHKKSMPHAVQRAASSGVLKGDEIKCRDDEGRYDAQILGKGDLTPRELSRNLRKEFQAGESLQSARAPW